MNEHEPRGDPAGRIAGTVSRLPFLAVRLVHGRGTADRTVPVVAMLPADQRVRRQAEEDTLPPDLHGGKPVQLRHAQRGKSRIRTVRWRIDPGEAVQGANLAETDRPDHLAEILPQPLGNALVADLELAVLAGKGVHPRGELPVLLLADVQDRLLAVEIDSLLDAPGQLLGSDAQLFQCRPEVPPGQYPDEVRAVGWLRLDDGIPVDSQRLLEAVRPGRDAERRFDRGEVEIGRPALERPRRIVSAVLGRRCEPRPPSGAPESLPRLGAEDSVHRAPRAAPRALQDQPRQPRT